MSTYLLVLAALVSNIVATPAAAVAPTSTICTATAFSQISAAVASCTNIVLSNIAMPANETINLLNLKTGTTVTFDGLTTFAFTNSSTFNPITINHGTGVTIQGAPGSVINGNGQAYWDGQGSNGGVPKYVLSLALCPNVS
jgi:polygalacturonase